MVKACLYIWKRNLEHRVAALFCFINETRNRPTCGCSSYTFKHNVLLPCY